MNAFVRIVLAFSAAAALASCGGPAAMNAVPGGGREFAHRAAGSLGPVLSTSDGGQIFGFDIDQNGKDGVLASASYTDISVQTFDETTGKITKTFGVKTG